MYRTGAINAPVAEQIDFDEARRAEQAGRVPTDVKRQASRRLADDSNPATSHE